MSNQVEYLVLDANAIIHGHGMDFFQRAKHIVTIAEVLDEIKDDKARDLLARLPYTIETREPTAESCKLGNPGYTCEITRFDIDILLAFL